MKDSFNSSVGGIRIKSIAWIGITVCVFIMAIIYLEIFRVDDNCQSLIHDTETCIEGQRCAISLGQSSDYLTEKVRLFVAKQNLEDMRLYFAEVKSHNRENMVSRLAILYGETESTTVARLKKAMQESAELEHSEVHAMRLVCSAMGVAVEDMPQTVAQWNLTSDEMAMSREEMIGKAYDLVYGAEYLQAKQRIKTDIDDTRDLMTDKMERMQGERGEELKRTFAEQRLFVFLMMLLVCGACGGIGMLFVHPIREHVRSIREDRKWKIIGVHELRYLAYVYNQIYDVNESYKKSLEYEASHDALTGLLSRAAFEKKREELEDKKLDCGLVLVDINEFKKINDTRGHKVGDEAIRRVARSLSELNLEHTTCVARIGGDEFAIILQGATEEFYPVIEEAVQKMNGELAQEEGELPSISVSAGVAFSSEGYTNKLFRQADQAMYYAKKQKRRNGYMYEQ